VTDDVESRSGSSSINGDGYEDVGITLSNLIFLNPDYEFETFKNDYEELVCYCSNITVYADSRDVALKTAVRMTQKRSFGLSALIDESSNMDIDIVDTGDLDRNMSSQFHGYFNINRIMVDDLWDLIVTGKRADERNSRLKPYGKVYRFIIIPSSVVTV